MITGGVQQGQQRCWLQLFWKGKAEVHSLTVSGGLVLLSVTAIEFLMNTLCPLPGRFELGV